MDNPKVSETILISTIVDRCVVYIPFMVSETILISTIVDFKHVDKVLQFQRQF